MVFDTKKETKGLEESTFDILNVRAFYNTRPWTILSYISVWILFLLKLSILGGDTYTCISLLAFNRWLSQEYEVYKYRIAKWIFAGCILFRIALLVYQILWAVHVFRTRNIALAYLNNYARMMYVLRSYNYQCLFNQIDLEGFFEWACFFEYSQLDDALETLVADLPRQVINFMTLRFYATGGELNNAILANIQTIAMTNVRLAVVLSVQLCSLAIFLFFFLQFVLAMILFIPIKVKVSHKGFQLLKQICYYFVNNNVRYLVKKSHKPTAQLVAEGIMDYKEVQENPLLASESSISLNNAKNSYLRTSSPFESSVSVPMNNVVLSAIDYQGRPPPRSNKGSGLRNEVFVHGSDENPFADGKSFSLNDILADLSDIPAPVCQPLVTRNSSSLGPLQHVRKQAENILYHSNPSSLENLRLFSDSARPESSYLEDRNGFTATHTASSGANDHYPIESAHSGLYASLPARIVLPLALVETKTRPDGFESAGSSLGSDTSLAVFEQDSHERLYSPYPVKDEVVDQTPYPVRGVSQYLDEFKYKRHK